MSARDGSEVRASGFTLLELLVVTAILALTAAVLAPSLVWRRADIERARAELQTMIRLLRAEASSTGVPHRLKIEIPAGRCVMEVLEEGRYQPLRRTLAAGRTLQVDRVVDLLTPAGSGGAIGVHPGGFVDPSLLEAEVDGQVWTLSVHALTGRVERRPGRARER